MTGASTPVGAALRIPEGSSPAAALRFIQDITSDVDSVQERVLAEILAQNADTEYLRNSGATDRVTFRARVPMVEYEHLLPYIQRIANGDRSAILSTRPVSEFLASSGTTGGERKLMPSTKDDHDRRKLLNSLVMPVRNMYFPGVGKGKGLYFALVKPGTTTPSGIPVRALTTSLFMNEHLRNRSAARPHDTSPTAAILCAETSQGMYAQMLCGLCQRHDVVRIGAVFASGLLRAFRSLQLSWEQLAADIEAGELASSRVTDPSVREAVADILRPDPELAQFIRAECSSGDWEGIVTRIWPNTRYLDTIVTGAMAQYLPTLKYYSGGLPTVSSIYGSSECYFGLNLNPMCDPSEVSYTIMPNMGYFEFLPVDAGADASQLVELARVEPGREYEVVVTTYAGLNRYRVGDILRVTGFHNTAPEFRFVRRQNVLLSVENDKTGEAELQRAVELAAARLRPQGASVREYTSHACTKSIPGHYVVYWELQLAKGGVTVDGETLDMCCLDMEEALSTVYRQGRVAGGSIGPLEIRVVRSGTFEDLMDYAISRGASFTQYKVPRCVNLPPILDLLDSHVVSSHFSPSLPHWTPGRRSE